MRKLVRRMKFHRLASVANAMSKATISPARTPGVVAASATSRTAATKAAARQASPNSNLLLKSMLLHAPVERAAAKPKLGGGKRNVEMMHAQRAFDHLLLELIEIQGFARGRNERTRLRSARQWEVVGAVMLSFGHDHRALGRVAKRSNIARPVVLHEQFEDSLRKLPPRLV